MQMLKYFIVSFALLSLILSGCGSKSPEPQVIEEKEEVEVTPALHFFPSFYQVAVPKVRNLRSLKRKRKLKLLRKQKRKRKLK